MREKWLETLNIHTEALQTYDRVSFTFPTIPVKIQD